MFSEVVLSILKNASANNLGECLCCGEPEDLVAASNLGERLGVTDTDPYGSGESLIITASSSITCFGLVFIGESRSSSSAHDCFIL